MAYTTYKKLGLTDNQALVATAQDALETGWGKHLAGKNNYGGIKAYNNKNATTTRTREYVNGRYVYMNEPFANYDSFEDYAKAKISLLNTKRYRAFSNDNIDSIIDRIVSGGYATDPKYGNTLKSVILTTKKKLA